MYDIVNKLWGFCHQLRHDGIDYADYIEQLTYLLFLKMSNERDIALNKITWTNEKHEKITTDCSWLGSEPDPDYLRSYPCYPALHHRGNQP